MLSLTNAACRQGGRYGIILESEGPGPSKALVHVVRIMASASVHDCGSLMLKRHIRGQCHHCFIYRYSICWCMQVKETATARVYSDPHLECIAKPGIEVPLCTKEARHEEVKEAPQLHHIVLHWGSTQNEPVQRRHALAGLKEEEQEEQTTSSQQSFFPS